MARNLTRSRSGLPESSASSSSRQLTFSHDSSRFKKRARLFKVLRTIGQCWAAGYSFARGVLVRQKVTSESHEAYEQPHLQSPTTLPASYSISRRKKAPDLLNRRQTYGVQPV